MRHRIRSTPQWSGWTERRRSALILSAIFAILVVLHFALSRGMAGPTIIDNELGYLANARVLSGGTAPLHPWFTPTNYMGYSFLLVPLYWAGLGPDAVYQGALLINAFLGGSVALISYPIARGLLGLTRVNSLLAAAASGLYPAVLINSSLAWAENLLYPLGLLTILLAYRLLTHPGVGTAALFGGIAGFLYMAHPRLLVSTGLVLIFIIAVTARRLVPPSLALVAGGTLVMLAMVARIAHDELLPMIYGEEGAAFADDRIASYFSVLTSANDAWTSLLSATGTVWYLALASGGLAIVGGVNFARTAVRGAEDRQPAVRWVALLALGLAIAAIAVSAIGIDDAGRRIDYRFYGRYADAYGPLLILGGAAAILSASTARQRILRWASGTAIGIAAFLVMYFGYGPKRFDPPEYTAGAAVVGAIAPGWLAYPSDPGYRVHLAVAVLALSSLVCIAIAGWSGRAAVILAATLFCVSSTVALTRYIEPQSEAINATATLEESVALRDVRSISYDRAGEQIFVMPLYEFHLPKAQFDFFDSRAGEMPDSSFVIAASGWDDAEALGARAVAEESSVDQVLWVLPGPQADALVAAGHVLPEPLSAPLPPEAMHSGLSTNGDHIEVCTGDTRMGSGVLRHDGTANSWRQTAFATTRSPGGWVYLVSQWRSRDGRGAVTRERMAGIVPRTLAPGERAQVHFDIAAIDDSGTPLEPGDYTMRLSPHQDGVGSFWAVGPDDPHDFPVTVSTCD